MRFAITAFCIAIATGCGSSGEVPVVEKKQARPAERIVDMTIRFPKDDLVESKVVQSNLAGKDFMPGGNFAEYESKGKKHQMFFSKRRDGNQALYLFMDYKDVLKDAKFIAHFGGYFGDDNGVPTLVFPKGEYVVGVTGLEKEEADMVARTMAANLN